jgi:hypothetical protein
MNASFWILILYAIVMIAFSLYTSGIGIWGLVKKRPLIIAARRQMWFLLIYVPITLQSFVPLFDSWGRNDMFVIILSFIQVAMMILLVYASWRQTTGYMIFGVSDETFLAALTSALKTLNLPFEETVSKMKLTSMEVPCVLT